jgi:hypothetical protein
MSDRYKFDGFDAVIDTENDDAIEYDGLDSRAAGILAGALNDNEMLSNAMHKLTVILNERNLDIERLTTPTDEQIDSMLESIKGIAQEVDAYEYGLPLYDPQIYKLRKAYDVYLRTPEWKQIRRRALVRDDFLCQNCFCKITHSSAEVHHLTYDSLRRTGITFTFEVVSLCSACHKLYHSIEE